MTGPTSRPLPAITNEDRLASVGAWSVHRVPGHGHESQAWPGYQPIPPAVPPGPTFPTQATPLTLTAPLTQVPTAVPPSHVPMGVAAPSRPARRSRSAEVALVLAAFVATAGVAFAIGRWSAGDSPTAAPTQAISQLPAGVQVPEGPGLPAGVQLPAGGQPRSAVEPTVAAADEGSTTPGATAAADEGSTTAAADTIVAAPASIDGMGDLPAGLPAAGGSQGPPGAMAGFGPGGLQGMVSAIEDGTLALTTEDGTTVSVATDASTAYVRETAIEAAEVGIGDLVSVQLPFAGVRGQGDATGDVPLIAEQVTLLPASVDWCRPACLLPCITIEPQWQHA